MGLRWYVFTRCASVYECVHMRPLCLCVFMCVLCIEFGVLH